MLLVEDIEGYVTENPTGTSWDLENDEADDLNAAVAAPNTLDETVYEMFYEEFDNTMDVKAYEQTMNIIFFGPLEDYMRIKHDSLLNMISTTRKFMIPINRVLLVWDMINDGKSPKSITAEELTAFGQLINKLPEEDIYLLNVSDPNILRYISKAKFIKRKTLGILAASYRRVNGDNWKTNVTVLNSLGALLCGFPSSHLKQIPPSVVRQVSLNVMDNLDRCDYDQAVQLYQIAVNLEAFDKPHTWKSHDIRNLGLLFIFIPPKDISSLSLSAMSGIAERVISVFDRWKLALFNWQQVFIGRVPHDCFEDILVPLFRLAGDLYEFRLMINFSGWNRGYAFAMYTTQEAASNAIRMFNNYAIRPSWLLGVCQSINNCRIYVSKIPAGTSSEDVVRLVYSLTEEVREVRVRRAGGGVCAAIVEYNSHRGAAMARKALVAAAASYGGHLAVDWSLPQSPQLMKQYREVGRWTPERGVEIWLAEEITPPSEERVARACTLSPPHVPHVTHVPHVPDLPSYGLEPWSLARRNRMIEEAARATANNVAQVALRDEPRPQPGLPPAAVTKARENGYYDLMMEEALPNESLQQRHLPKMVNNFQDRFNVDFKIGMSRSAGDSGDNCRSQRQPTSEPLGVFVASPKPDCFDMSSLRQWIVANAEVTNSGGASVGGVRGGVGGAELGIGGAGSAYGDALVARASAQYNPWTMRLPNM